MIDTAFGLNGAESGGQFANYAQERVRVMSVDTLRYRFHNRKEAGNPLKARQNSSEHGLEEAVSRALRDNLAPLQRTADDLQHAYSDLVAACSSSRPSNALPALLRAQTSAAALAAGLSVLSNFVAVALNPREESSPGARARALASAAVEVEEEEAATSAPASAEPELSLIHISGRNAGCWREHPPGGWGMRTSHF